MKGTDVTRAEFDHAEEFLDRTQTRTPWMLRQDTILLRREQFIQMLAWYGAVRARGKPPQPFFMNQRDVEETAASTEPTGERPRETNTPEQS